MWNWKWPIVLKTSESIWRYPVFVLICYVSIRLEISAALVRSAPEGFCRDKDVRAKRGSDVRLGYAAKE
jgi:hypothetical protein